MPRVLVSTTSFAEHDSTPVDMLKAAGLDAAFNPYGRKLTEDEAAALLEGVDYLIAGTERLSRRVLAASKALKVISRCGVGLDNVDLAAADELGIKVFNTPFGPTQAVVELTIGLMLDLLRNISLSDRQMRAGAWKKKTGFLLRRKTVGIVGLGRIGKSLIKHLEPFEPGIMAYDLSPDWNFCEARGIKICPLGDLLESSDIVSLHISGCSAPIIGERELKTMKKTALLINTSRGEAVDEAALYDALKNGLIAGAGLDTFGREPYSGPLLDMDNAVLTPHIGSYALESRIGMETDAVKNLLAAIGK